MPIFLDLVVFEVFLDANLPGKIYLDSLAVKELVF